MAKRKVNIEIASGLVDLLMDLQDETFKIMMADPKRQVPKPQWREFIQIFKDGKLCSNRNVKAAPVISDEKTEVEKSDFDTSGAAYDLLLKCVNEPYLSNFYDYLSLSGQF